MLPDNHVIIIPEVAYVLCQRIESITMRLKSFIVQYRRDVSELNCTVRDES